MSNYYVWAAMDRAHDYRAGDPVPDGAGAYLHAADTLEAAREAMTGDPATYESEDGHTAPLYIAEDAGEEGARIVSGPHSGSAWPMPYTPKRYRPDLGAFVSLAGEYPTRLEEPYTYYTDDVCGYFCEDHAREWAAANGLEWYNGGAQGDREDVTVFSTPWRDGESDTPVTCEACDTYLDVALTYEGDDYVRENYPAHVWHLWGVE
jgi:hypothetical protein